MHKARLLGSLALAAVIASGAAFAAGPQYKTAPIDTVYGQGVINPYGKFFTGTSYLQPLVGTDLGVVFNASNVTFEPCTRTYWHSHSNGQVLFVVAGEGRHQIRGQQVEIIKTGDVVIVPPGVEHWHGGGPDTWMSHVAFAPVPENNTPTWLDPVTDEEYNAPAKPHQNQQPK
ncbi:MAG: cupin domain-containing protein [Proteobacteria bacterium]|uniref:Cupin domain-containing protein n=1 Tax=Candidatus Avisuccinivibrio stercorigallinarum TaxID=2840704 RepID=A0A9D9DBY7_9GAMM|nr:cupin domain-containing protein [Candidatus Avisuccinivibrio stercorigallinarum]